MGRDYELLRRKILGKYGQTGLFAKDLKVTQSTLSLKLSGKTDWRRAEIEKAARLLSLTADEVWLIFFA